MFYLKTLTHTVLLHPRDFGRNVKDRLKKILVKEVSGSNFGKDGHVIAVCRVDQSVSRGKLQTATGLAVFHIKFEAILLRPYVNEVYKTQVDLCNQHGFFARIGPLEIFVTCHLFQQAYEYKWIPDQEEWVSGTEDDERITISKDSTVFLRIVSCDLREGKWTVVGKIDEYPLGVV